MDEDAVEIAHNRLQRQDDQDWLYSFKVPLHLFFSLRNVIELNALILKQKKNLRSELWLLSYDLSKS